jgi:2'-5' RNA ligase
VRLFAAVEIEDEARAAVGRAVRSLRGRLARVGAIDVRWIAEENLHLTIWFLGEVAEPDVERVMAALEPAISHSPFRLTLDGSGVFPPSGAPRVIWIGVSEGAAALSGLHDEVGTRLAPGGFVDERRPFAAHLTIGRVREVRPRSGGYAAVRRLITDTRVAAISSPVTHLTVFRSHLSPKGARYEAVLRVPLKG